MFKKICQNLGLLLCSVVWLACGETVNYATREKAISPESWRDLNPSSEDPSGNADSLSDAQTLDALCRSPARLSKSETLSFPEIPQGTTCTFAAGENLSRQDGYIRAYLRQTQQITLPEGATLCAFSILPTDQSMRYDDEMLLLLNEKVLLATKDYTDYFPADGMFHTFSWDALRNQVYNQTDARGLYCVGGEEGLSRCQLPVTETSGRIELNFGEELMSVLAKSLQRDKILDFSWITTGDNDNSDCRHTALNLPVVVDYVPAQSGL